VAGLGDLFAHQSCVLLYACDRVRVCVCVPADTPVPNLQESLLKIDTEIKEAHNVHQKLIKNTRTAASRFHAGE
jgi:hypothetical protein